MNDRRSAMQFLLDVTENKMAEHVKKYSAAGIQAAPSETSPAYDSTSKSETPPAYASSSKSM